VLRRDAETAAILVPTRTIVSELLGNAQGVQPFARAKMEAVAAIHAEAVARAYERGVMIAMGTDIAITGSDMPNSWGRNGREPALLVECGMTPLDAIAAATANGPLTLGPQAPLSGQLAAGYAADVITLSADPVADISVLARPAQVTAVWQAGRQVKGAPAA
jgi:imidazolonepropionase-like amidohydrolase